MITIPWIIFCVVGGALSALGGWLFHLVFKNHKENVERISAMDARLNQLDPNQTNYPEQPVRKIGRSH